MHFFPRSPPPYQRGSVNGIQGKTERDGIEVGTSNPIKSLSEFKVEDEEGERRRRKAVLL